MSLIPPTRSNPVKLQQLTEQQVHAMALDALSRSIALQSRGEQSSPEKVFNVLLGAGARRSSIEQECQDRPGAPSANLVRRTLRESLELEKTEADLNRALAEHLERRYWKGPQIVAVDLHDQPYHGEPLIDPREVRRGPAKSGTTHFHSYATAYVVRKGRRLTLALHFVHLGETIPHVLDALKARLDALGIGVKLWLADKGFFSVEALAWFDEQPLAYVPMPLRGKENPPSPSRILAASKYSHWATYTMYSDTAGAELTFDVAVVRQSAGPSRAGKLRPAVTLLYAVVGQQVHDGVQGREVQAVAEVYRRRFGIESSYRQLLQARFVTSSRCPALRLLSIGLALLLRNLWVLCQWLLSAQPGPGARRLVILFRFKKLLHWINRMVDIVLGFETLHRLQAPSPLRF